MSPEPGPRGWPFLIGAGRRHEYRTLIAPDFLVAASEYGILDRHARHTAEGETRVVPIRPDPRPLWMAYETRTVTGADVPDPRDEHSRPLQILTGFVTEAPIEHPDPADLALARDTGMAVYRRYLRDEDGFAVLTSEAFPLRSTLRPAAAGSAPAVRRRPISRRTLSLLGLIALVVAAAVTALALTFSGGDEPSCVPATDVAAVQPQPSGPACR